VSDVNINRPPVHMPIMLKSQNCNLKGLTPIELVRHHEEAEVCNHMHSRFAQFYENINVVSGICALITLTFEFPQLD
jgi:hypothetical protein